MTKEMPLTHSMTKTLFVVLSHSTNRNRSRLPDLTRRASVCGDLRQLTSTHRSFGRKDRCQLPLVSDALRGAPTASPKPPRFNASHRPKAPWAAKSPGIRRQVAPQLHELGYLKD